MTNSVWLRMNNDNLSQVFRVCELVWSAVNFKPVLQVYPCSQAIQSILTAVRELRFCRTAQRVVFIGIMQRWSGLEFGRRHYFFTGDVTGALQKPWLRAL